MLTFLSGIFCGFSCYFGITGWYTYVLRCRFYNDKLLAPLEDKLVKLPGQIRLRQRLDQAGRPWGMRPLHYYLLHVAVPMFLWCFLHQAVPAVNLAAAMVLGFFVVDILIYSCRRERKKAFNMDFPILLETVELAVTAGLPEEQAFLLAAENVRSKAMKEELALLAARLYAAKDPSEALQAFSERVTIPEAKILEMAVSQGQKTGKVKGVLENITNSMFNQVISIINVQEKACEYKIMAALFILLAGIMNLLFQAYFTDLNIGLQGIFG